MRAGRGTLQVVLNAHWIDGLGVVMIIPAFAIGIWAMTVSPPAPPTRLRLPRKTCIGTQF